MTGSYRPIIVLVLLLVFVIPLGTAAIVVGVAGFDIVFGSLRTTPEQRALEEQAERFAGYTFATKNPHAPIVLGQPGKLIEERSARIKIILDDHKLAGETWKRKIAAAKILAPSIAQQECAALLATFARECRVDRSVVDVWSDTLSVNLTLSFTEKVNMGEIREGNKTIDTIRQEYTTYDDDRVAVANQAAYNAERLKIYRLAAKDCGTTRAVYGICSMMDVRIDGSLVGSRKLREVSLTAYADMVTVTGPSVQSVAK